VAGRSSEVRCRGARAPGRGDPGMRGCLVSTRWRIAARGFLQEGLWRGDGAVSVPGCRGLRGVGSRARGLVVRGLDGLPVVMR